ncbi:unnamed protein product [Thlaspi arvense]|uniref:DUF4283 domain-containing protein n=1 Tax=Thlaspi arvense TaxID=13288 RepID=A0AAU9STD2_THLAR|nr:unnamed protein product [Thlaspi arvense]
MNVLDGINRVNVQFSIRFNQVWGEYEVGLTIGNEIVWFFRVRWKLLRKVVDSGIHNHGQERSSTADTAINVLQIHWRQIWSLTGEKEQGNHICQEALTMIQVIEVVLMYCHDDCPNHRYDKSHSLEGLRKLEYTMSQAICMVSGGRSKGNKGKETLPRRLKITVPHFDNTPLLNAYSKTLIGRCMNLVAQDIQSLLFMLPRIWKVEERVAGADLGMGKFQFNFDEEEDIIAVLQMEPYKADKRDEGAMSYKGVVRDSNEGTVANPPLATSQLEQAKGKGKVVELRDDKRGIHKALEAQESRQRDNGAVYNTGKEKRSGKNSKKSPTQHSAKKVRKALEFEEQVLGMDDLGNMIDRVVMLDQTEKISEDMEIEVKSGNELLQEQEMASFEVDALFNTGILEENSVVVNEADLQESLEESVLAEDQMDMEEFDALCHNNKEKRDMGD